MRIPLKRTKRATFYRDRDVRCINKLARLRRMRVTLHLVEELGQIHKTPYIWPSKRLASSATLEKVPKSSAAVQKDEELSESRRNGNRSAASAYERNISLGMAPQL